MAENWTPPQHASAAPAHIPNYLILSIVSIFCCWGGAIIAMTNAVKVNKLIAAGDIKGATEASANAKKWAFISIGIGVAVSAELRQRSIIDLTALVIAIIAPPQQQKIETIESIR